MVASNCLVWTIVAMGATTSRTAVNARLTVVRSASLRNGRYEAIPQYVSATPVPTAVPQTPSQTPGGSPYKRRTLAREVVRVATKTQRIEMRTDPDSEGRIAQAAREVHLSVSAFVLDAAITAADRVLARVDHLVMPSDQFDALLDSLDRPDDAPTLSRVAARIWQAGPE